MKRWLRAMLFTGGMLWAWLGGACTAYGKEKDSLEIEFHYIRYNEDYQDWNLWLWTNGNDGRAIILEPEGTEVTAKVTLEDVEEDTKVGILVRKGNWEEKDIPEDRFLDLTKSRDGKLQVYLWQEEPEVYYDKQEAAVRILNASLESETEICFKAYIQEGEEETFRIEDKDGNPVACKTKKAERNGSLVSGSLILDEAAELPNTYYLTIGRTKKSIRFGGIYDTKLFRRNFIYRGDDLGVTCRENKSCFCLWSPMAESVTLCLYEAGEGGTPFASYPMERGRKGVWRCEVEEDCKNKYYTYQVNVQGEEWEVTDPYAQSTGINGQRGMIVSHEEASPENFEDDGFRRTPDKREVILYEMSVRDYTSDEASGIKERGKYLGLTEENTKNPQGDSTGLSYLGELGITHVHLLPIQDFGGLDEKKPEESYNWGYVPMNHFTPEGAYSTDPFHGEVRVKECKEMIKSLHEKNIGVVMDVVYNHTYQNVDSNLNRIVPGYYYRIDENGIFSDGSRCGNELATEREMVRKYMIDSLRYWMEEYHVDGFRFDLMGLIDVETMKTVEKEIYRINPDAVLYGEGWNAGESIYEGETMESLQAWQTPGIGTFNNVFRRAVQKYVCGMTEEESTLLGMRFGFAGAGKRPAILKRMGSWTKNPLQCINYASCHDGYTLWDLITLNCPNEDEAMWERRDRFGAAAVLLCQGTPFIQSGEEFLRSKTSESNPEVKYSNSYNASDYVNKIAWENRTVHKNVQEYYTGLAEFRKAHPGLAIRSQRELNRKLVYIDNLPQNVLGYYTSERKNIFQDYEICILLNPTGEAVEYLPKAGAWEIYVNGDAAGTELLETKAEGEPLCAEPVSAVAAVRTVIRTDKIVFAFVITVLVITAGGVVYRYRRKRAWSKSE